MAFYRFCSPYVDVCDFEQEREQHREESFCAAMWSILLREMHRRMQKGDFPAVCNLHRDIARLYELEQCNEQAAYHFVTALYIQYSGLRIIRSAAYATGCQKRKYGAWIPSVLFMRRP